MHWPFVFILTHIHILLPSIMIFQEQYDEQSPSLFKKGMKLNEYIAEMANSASEFKQDEEKPEEDLYETCHDNKHTFSKKLITYEIRESDQDEYDESLEESRKVEMNNYASKLSTKLQESTHIPSMQKNKTRQHTNISQDNKIYMSNSKGFRVRRQSNSPLGHLRKENAQFSPEKNFAHTLHQNQWKNINQNLHKNSLMPQASTTLYGKFLKGVKDRSNQKHFKKKNNRELQYVIKYERQVNSKYSGFNMNDFKIQGVADRLHERRPVGKIHK